MCSWASLLDQTEVTRETEGQDVNAPQGCHPAMPPTPTPRDIWAFPLKSALGTG